MAQIEASASLSGTGSVRAEGTVYRQEFVEVLTLLAGACDAMNAQGFSRPIVVGGAAVEFYTSGAVVSGDFDFVTEWQPQFQGILLGRGFVREDRPGRLYHGSGGLYHPTLGFAVEVVSGRFFDGRGDQNRVRLVDMQNGGAIPIAAIEDLIADRLGQYVSNKAGMGAMLQQALMLHSLARDIDEEYLDRRIREDTLGELALDDLKEMAP